MRRPRRDKERGESRVDFRLRAAVHAHASSWLEQHAFDVPDDERGLHKAAKYAATFLRTETEEGLARTSFLLSYYEWMKRKNNEAATIMPVSGREAVRLALVQLVLVSGGR